MTSEYESKNKTGLLVLFIILLVAGIGYLAWFTFAHKPVDEQTFCTQDAMLCPDGSYVGRVAPACEFAPCPTAPTDNNNWTTARDEASGITFQYPPELQAEYISATDWPPTFQVLDENYSCTEAGDEIQRAGRTEERQVDNRRYCVTTVTEGAAGSIYSQYAYAFERSNRLVIMNFTLRFPQCANYDDPRRTACEGEREAFDPDGIADRIAQTVVLP